MRHKAATIEWSLGLHDGATCVGKTHEKEDQLFACESGFMSAKETGSLAEGEIMLGRVVDILRNETFKKNRNTSSNS